MKSKVLCASLVIQLCVSVINVTGQEKITIELGIDNKLDAVVKETGTTTEISKTSSKSIAKFVCPGKEVRQPPFALPCSMKKDCDIFGKSVLCCDKRCTQGVKPPEPKSTHPRNKLEAKVKETTETTSSKKVTSHQKDDKSKTLTTSATKFVCPGKEIAQPFFALPCSTKKDCDIFGRSVLCCDKRCIQGVKPPKPEPTHSPTLFGFVQQTCPKEPIAEIFEIKECTTDEHCVPRICCPETLKSGEKVGYCRTAQPLWDNIPAPRQLVDPIRALIAYMQCTPPPPALFDLFPKPCDSQLDCFPNLCCQEGGKRYCRPPKRSLVTLIAGIGQRIIPTDAAREFIKRIS